MPTTDAVDTFAHTAPPPATREEWEPYATHAANVAAIAARFGDAFGAAAWGRLAGLWHDLGKLQPDFQRYLRGELADGPPHAWTGAVLALDRSSPALLPVASAIAAHHGALANVTPDAANGVPAGDTLRDLVARRREPFHRLRSSLPADVLAGPLPAMPPHVLDGPPDPRRVELFTRMLFSALVDADRSATAAFYARFQSTLTADDLAYDDVPALADRLDAAIDALPPKGSPAVVELRRQVLEACRARAADRPGRFNLTVPTGGGKTLSAMSFALRHAAAHGLRRVIVVIPYTSIIEQSAKVNRDVLGRSTILEHHSNLDEQKLRESDSCGGLAASLNLDNDTTVFRGVSQCLQRRPTGHSRTPHPTRDHGSGTKTIATWSPLMPRSSPTRLTRGRGEHCWDDGSTSASCRRNGRRTCASAAGPTRAKTRRSPDASTTRRSARVTRPLCCPAR